MKLSPKLLLLSLVCSFTLGIETTTGFAAAPLGDAGEAALAASGAVTITSQGNGTVTNPPLQWLGVSNGAVPQVDETTNAIDGVNHDFFILTVGGQPADWAGKQISVKIDWTVPANDYDLHVHKDTEFGPEVYTSAGGAPSTEERVSIDPTKTGTGVYYLNVSYFTAPSTPNTPPPGNYQGTLAITNNPAFRSALYTHGGMTFSKNSTTKAPTSSRDGEPSSRVDGLGNYYVCGIRGVPAGVDLWYFDLRPTSTTYDPTMRVPIYRGQPDSPTSANGQNQLSAGALGGGDIDLAVGIGNYTGAVQLNQKAEAVPALAYASLTAANVTIGNSLDRGQTFAFNGAGNILAGVPINDRQWMGFKGSNIVYLVYRNFGEGIAFVQQSKDAGFSYGPANPIGGVTFPQTGALDVDQTDGTVYFSSNDGQVAVGKPSDNPPPLNTPNDAPMTYTKHRAVPAGVDSANIFFPIRVGGDGTVYGTYSDGKNIFLVSSSDHGATWTPPVQVNDPADVTTKTNLIPWLAAGPKAGSVGVAWYGTNSDINDDSAVWRVYYGLSLNAKSTAPSFRIAQASDHSIHAANISLKGLPLTGVAPNRNLIDYFQINFDPKGAAVIGYTDDHNDFDGDTFVTRQLSGPSINGGSLASSAPGSALPAQPFALPGTVGVGGAPAPQPMQPGANGEQVTDFAQDQDSGLLAVAPANSPVDIISIKYVGKDVATDHTITATLKVSDLTAIPPASNWRMYFTANAPELGIVGIPGNQYSKGLSDHGDQFYLQASTSAAGTPGFTWGTAVRNFDGSLTRTQRGTADGGSFNQANRTISVTISQSKLNAYLASISHPALIEHSVLCGLRGQANSASLGLEDDTRGGTQFTLP